MSSRLIALLVWALAAASVVFWAMRLVTTAAPVPEGTRLAMNGPLAGGDLSRLLGAPRIEAGPAVAAPPPAASRFKLTGIVSTSSRRNHDGQAGPGVAIISIDGAPAKAYRVGDVIDGQLALWSVALRSARIGDRSGGGSEAFVLELPPPAAPATGTLAAATAPPAPGGLTPGMPATTPPGFSANPQMAPRANPAGTGSATPAFTAPPPPTPTPAPAMPTADTASGSSLPNLRQNDVGALQGAPADKLNTTNSSAMRQ